MKIDLEEYESKEDRSLLIYILCMALHFGIIFFYNNYIVLILSYLIGFNSYVVHDFVTENQTGSRFKESQRTIGHINLVFFFFIYLY